MGAALPSYPPPALPPRRAKVLPLTSLSAVRHLRSETRGPWRTRSRELVAQAMAETHALVLDVPGREHTVGDALGLRRDR